MKFESKSRSRSPIVFPAAALVLVTSLSAPVAEGRDCLLDYANCVDAASELDSFGRRSLAGLRCYADLLQCIQRQLA